MEIKKIKSLSISEIVDKQTEYLHIQFRRVLFTHNIMGERKKGESLNLSYFMKLRRLKDCKEALIVLDYTRESLMNDLYTSERANEQLKAEILGNKRIINLFREAQVKWKSEKFDLEVAYKVMQEQYRKQLNKNFFQRLFNL
jgi:hypothetical protein